MAFPKTAYFSYRRGSRDRQGITDEMIESVLQRPLYSESQQDGRLRKWGWIVSEQRFLRVIVLEDGITVHNALFDRSFKGTYR